MKLNLDPYSYYGEGNDAIPKEILEYRTARKRINDWYGNQPEVIAAIDENHRICMEIQKEDNQKSFQGRGLSQPGTLIQYVDPNANKIVEKLIGHFNPEGLLASCCADELPNETIILRYKVIYTSPHSNELDLP